MATFSELQARVSANVIDLPDAVQNAIPTFVQEAYRKAQTVHNWFVMRATASFTTTLDQRLLASAPADFKEWRDKPFAVDNLGGSWELGIADDERALLTIYGRQDTGRPYFLALDDPDLFGVQPFNVWPLPDGISDYPDGEYRIVVPYWRYLPVLADGADHNWLTDSLPQYIVFLATQEAFGMDWDEERMIVYTQKASRELQDALHADKVKQLSGMDTLVPVWRGYRGHRVSR